MRCLLFAVAFCQIFTALAYSRIQSQQAQTPYFLKMMSFNAQIFGKTKLEKDDVIQVFLNLFDRNDVSMMMEIREKDEKSFPIFVELLNEFSDNKYNATMSDRKGRSQSKEQYGFIWREDKVRLLELWEYEDEDDVFEREPVVARFEDLRTSKVVNFLATHISPKSGETIPELNGLVNVYDKFKGLYNTYDLLMAGDFNADCNYVCKSCWDQVDLFVDQRFYWLISSYANTTAAKSSCAYDRVIVAGETMSKTVRDAHVFRYDLAYGLNSTEVKKVSDHFPIEFQVYLGNENEEETLFQEEMVHFEGHITKTVETNWFDWLKSKLNFAH